MHAHRRIVVGFLFAGLYTAAAVMLRPQILAYSAPRTLDVFLVGIGFTSFFFSWIPAVALFITSLVISIDDFPMSGVGDWLRIVVYTVGALGLIWAFSHLKKALARSREAEETKRLVLEYASDGIFLCSDKGVILDVNAAGVEMLGYARDELLKSHAESLLAREGVGNPFETGDGRILQERRLRRKDGGEVLAEVSSQRVADGRLIAVVRDITERARTQEAVRRSEALTRSVVYSAVDGIITIDENGLITSFNPAAERLFGYSADEVIEANVDLLMPEPYRGEHRSYLERYLVTGEQKIIRGGREAEGRRKDGSTFPLELAISEMTLPEGRMFTATVRDITERREAEEALREANETLRAVIETSPLAIFTMDLEGRVRSWNPAAERTFGYSESEVSGQLLPTVPEEELPELLAAIENARAGTFLMGAEKRRRRKNGSFVDVAIWNAALRDSAGNVTGIMSVMADITERRRLEDQLNQSQKMEAVGRLAGSMAHDFNNILTVISGYSRMMLDTMPADTPYRADIEEVLKASEHAAQLTSQLLTFSRRQVVHPKVINLNSVVVRVENILRRLIGEDLQLVSILNPDLRNVNADPGQFEQVILNLAMNARDAMSRGGKLTIETANVDLGDAHTDQHLGVAPGSYVMLAVSDTGRGMSREERSRLFEPFFTTKPRGKGTGLGLSTVYGIVKQAKGEIWVYSEPGLGTTVKIYLPQTEEAVEMAVSAPASVRDTRGSETVLLVEDELAVRKLVRDVLTHNGYRVLEAEDPPHALRICGKPGEHIDLLLTDVVMPEMSGRELADRVLGIRPGLRVLYMSGYTDTVIMDYGIPSPEKSFLAKPFTPAALSQKVREVLDSV